MDEKYDLADEIVALSYGLALITFGREAVEYVVNQTTWLGKYPNVIGKLRSEERTKYGVALPGEIVYEIAGREECLYDFYADPDGKRLYAVERQRKWAEPSAAETQGDRKISNQEALVTYGAYCLFAAVDRGIGYKGEKYE